MSSTCFRLSLSSSFSLSLLLSRSLFFSLSRSFELSRSLLPLDSFLLLSLLHKNNMQNMILFSPNRKRGGRGVRWRKHLSPTNVVQNWFESWNWCYKWAQFVMWSVLFIVPGVFLLVLQFFSLQLPPPPPTPDIFQIPNSKLICKQWVNWSIDSNAMDVPQPLPVSFLIHFFFLSYQCKVLHKPWFFSRLFSCQNLFNCISATFLQWKGHFKQI